MKRWVPRYDAITLGILLACAVAAWCPRARALNPELDVSQYAHTAWRIREGFTKDYPAALAQTPDGYLWLGTRLGVVRYDGARAIPWSPAGEVSATKVLAARDGTLWIGGLEGLASWKDGKRTDHPEFANLHI